MDLFAKVSSAAHEGAFGFNSRPEPSLAQLKAGNYAKGRVKLHGFRIAIETPQGQRRTGKSDGKPWSVICQAHYGYFEQVKGADGDELDVFIGPWPESLMAYVVNRESAPGQFDEHKVLLGFPDRASAINAYQNSYEPKKSGMGSVIACTLDQLRWWMKYGDLTRPLTPQQLPYDGNLLMNETLWDSTAQPVGSSPALLMYALRRSDQDLLLLDSVVVDDVLEDSEGEVLLDALVVPLNNLERKVGQIQAVMRVAGKEVKPVALQITPPFKQKGTTQVAAIIEMSDGQTVTIFFHNPDATPNQLTPDDEMVSWKWLLNKRDVTLVVAPEKGQDLNPREVGRRIMRLVEANSGKFQAANTKRSERMANIEQMKASIQDKEAELAQVLKEIETLKTAPDLAAQNATNPLFTQPTRAFEDYLSSAKGDSFEAAKAFFKAELQGKIVKTVIGDVHLVGSGFKEMKRGMKSDALKARLITKVPEILSSGRYDGRTELHKQRTDGFVAFHFFEKEVEIGTLLVTAGVNVGERQNKELLYTAYGLGYDGGIGWKNKAASATVLDAASREEVFRGPGVPSEPTTKPGSTPSSLPTIGLMVDRQGEEVNIVILKVVDKATGERLTEFEDSPENITPEGKPNTVKTAKGTKVETGFTVLEADQLIVSHDKDGHPNSDYPAELQPRDRGRATSQAWVQKTAKTLDPDSLGRTSRADSGAPIIGPDRVVESGNGRSMAIIEAYRQGTAEEYRTWLMEEAEHFGLDPERIRAMKAPVLVRVRTSDVDRRAFAVEANQDDKLAMTGTEKAKADADRLDMALLSKLSDEGDLLAANNRDFVKGFLASLGDAESAQYITSTGQPTGALMARIQAAIFAKAYSDDRLLELTADSSKTEVANIIEALNLSAPDFILAQAADAQGAQALTSKLVDSVEVSLNQQAVEAIIEATNLVRKARAEGTSVEEAVSQLGLFGDIPPATAAMALFINKNNRSSKRLGAAFKAMAQFVRQEAVRGQSVDLFGDDASQTGLQQVIEAANRQLEKEYGEGAYAIESLDLFGGESSQTQAAQIDSPAVVLTGKELGDFPDTPEGKKALRNTAQSFLESIQGAWVPCPALKADVEIRKAGIKKVISQSADSRKLKLVFALREIIGQSTKLDSRPPYDSDRDKSAKAYHILRSVVDLEGDTLAVRVVVKEDVNGVFHYDLTVHHIDLVLDSVKTKGCDKSQPSIMTTTNGGGTYPSRFARHQLGFSVDQTVPNFNGAALDTGLVLDSVGQEDLEGQFALNLFIEGEKPEVVEAEDDLDNNPDAAFLQTVIDGTVEDILAPELGDQIIAIYERHAEDPQMLVLIEQAAMAYEKAMLEATAHS